MLTLENIQNHILFTKYKGKLKKEGKKYFIDFIFNQEKHFCRILLDKKGEVQLICTFDFCDTVMPGEIGPELPHGGFISEEARDLFEEFLYPVNRRDLKRMSDSTLIEDMCESGGETIEQFFK